MQNRTITLKYSLIDFLFNNGDCVGRIERQYASKENLAQFDNASLKMAEDNNCELEIITVPYTDDLFYSPSGNSEIPDADDVYDLYLELSSSIIHQTPEL